ncbi:ABC transporter ATP-binding protein [Botrimarina sp.]|uniref:ABC transporter ATP-binding protein n=1 Tax=Botrimarina sp. TaxID=2795802 RepID=UPI0032EADC17
MPVLAPQPSPAPPREGEFAVSLRGVHKAYKRGGSATPVLRDVSLAISHGEAVFLLGPSGSGKTTLMSIVGCLLTADAGEVRVLGRDVTRLSLDERAALRRRRLGFVFQRFQLVRGLSAAENVAVPLRLDGWSSGAASKRAAGLLERVGLADRAHEAPHRLSVGQCQRVAIARALAAEPTIVLADEPTASLDAESGAAAMRLLRELTVDAGRTLVVVTHDHRIVPAAGSKERIVAMDSGRVSETESRAKRGGRPG